MMDAPISQSALGSSKEGCGGWRHLGKRKSHTDTANLVSLTLEKKKSAKCVLSVVCTCYLEMYV